MYKIDEVTKQVGLTKRTLRYYEEIGLIHPQNVVREIIRLYTDEDIARIKKNCRSERSARNHTSRNAAFLITKRKNGAKKK